MEKEKRRNEEQSVKLTVNIKQNTKITRRAKGYSSFRAIN